MARTGEELVPCLDPVEAPAGNIAREWRQHWRVGLASMIGMGVGASVHPQVFGLFILPLEEAFGWSRGQVTLALMSSLVVGLLAPLVGRLLDTRGVRPIILSGFALLGVFWSALAAMPGTLWVFYLLYMLMAISSNPTSGLGFTRAVCAHFVKTRGFSLAAARTGISVASFALPIMLFAIISEFGWRAGYLTMALLSVGVGLPITWWGLRDRTENLAATTGPGPMAKSNPRPTRELLKDPVVLLLALAAAMAYAPMLSILSQSQPILVDRGVDPAQASVLVGLLGGASLVGAFATGIMLDRLHPPTIALVLLLLGSAGAALLALTTGSLPAAILGTFMIGFTLGAEIDIVAFMVARYVGMRDYSSAFGVTSMAIASLAAGAAPAMGFLYDMQGNYTLALLIAAGMFAIAGLAYFAVSRMSHPENRAGR